MKALFSIGTGLVIQIGILATANANQNFQCINHGNVVYLSISDQSVFTTVSSNECNAGVGDPPTDCHIVDYHYENKQGFISYESVGQTTIKLFFQLQRYQNADTLFGGYTSVDPSPGRTDQISVGPSESNSKTYVVQIIHFLGSGPSGKNIGRIEYDCQQMQ